MATIEDFDKLDIRVGKIVEVITRQPVGGPIVISIDKRNTAIGRGMASRSIVAVE